MDKEFEYPKLYEELHRDIETFNEELETFNKRHEASFQDLLTQIERLIQNRFPGDFLELGIFGEIFVLKFAECVCFQI